MFTLQVVTLLSVLYSNVRSSICSSFDKINAGGKNIVFTTYRTYAFSNHFTVLSPYPRKVKARHKQPYSASCLDRCQEAPRCLFFRFQIHVWEELGRVRSCLKLGKICLEPSQMKCNEKPDKAERQCIEVDNGYFLLKAAEK